LAFRTHSPWKLRGLPLVARAAEGVSEKTAASVVADEAEDDAKESASAGKGSSKGALANVDWSRASDEWEVDCFSRPVMEDGKKMWELLVLDKNAEYRRVASMKPTRVNSVVVQKIIGIFIDEAEVKPKEIRFFRKVMKNMLNVALREVKKSKDMKELKVLPSRACHTMRQWITYRERNVYPEMPGYVEPPPRRANMRPAGAQGVPETLPGKLQPSKYAITALLAAGIRRVQPGMLPGKLCKLPKGLTEDTPIVGITLFSSRALVIALQLNSLDLCAARVDLETLDLLLDVGIETTYKVCQVAPEDREAALEFEKAKRRLGGLHFVAIHDPENGAAGIPEEGETFGGRGCVSALWTCIDYSPEEMMS